MITIEIFDANRGVEIFAEVSEREVGRFEIQYTCTDGATNLDGTTEFVTNKSMSTLDIVEIVATSIRWDSE